MHVCMYLALIMYADTSARAVEYATYTHDTHMLTYISYLHIYTYKNAPTHKTHTY
jgi:hypothetical protein